MCAAYACVSQVSARVCVHLVYTIVPFIIHTNTRTHRLAWSPVIAEIFLLFFSLFSKLNHPNIVGFRGFTKTAEGVDTLALEMCSTSLGSILEERHDEDLGPLPAKHTFKMIMDVAQALDFLHTEARLLHGDLKSFNVLVKGEFEICKLCDFGVTMPLDENGEINFNKNPQLEYVGKYLTRMMDDARCFQSVILQAQTSGLRQR